MSRFINKAKHFHPNSPLLYGDHKKPMTRRDFIAAGLCTGGHIVAGASLLNMFANPNKAHATLSDDLEALRDSCGFSVQGAGKIPFISFDLAGGANIVGSNVLVGGLGGQQDFLSTAGYNKLGLPGDMSPAIANPNAQQSDFVNTDLGLAFHSDSAFLRGILEKL